MPPEGINNIGLKSTVLDRLRKNKFDYQTKVQSQLSDSDFIDAMLAVWEKHKDD